MLYLVGGSSAVFVGWRPSTRGVDVRPEPDSDELLRALNDVKHELDINVELASPASHPADPCSLRGPRGECAEVRLTAPSDSC